MKNGIVSVVLALLGIAFVIWYNVKMSQVVEMVVAKYMINEELSLESEVFILNKWLQITACLMGVIGLLFGVKSLKEKKGLAVLGIFASAILIVLAFCPIWKWIIQNSALDINFLD